MKERTIIIKIALLYSIIAVIGLLLFDYFRGESSSIVWYVLNGIVFFIVIALKGFFWDDFVPFLEDSQQNVTKVKDANSENFILNVLPRNLKT